MFLRHRRTSRRAGGFLKVQILIWWIQDQAKTPHFPGMLVLEQGVKGPLSVQSAPTFHFQMSNEPSPPPPCLGVCWEGLQTGVRTSMVTRIRHGALERGHRLSWPQFAHP